MKSTEAFKRTILDYLTVRAKTDDLFAEKFADPNKNIDECVNFILNTVKDSGCNGFEDDEIYGIAVHYYDEEKPDASYLKSISGTVVVNHHVTLTEEEKKELEQKAKDDYYNEMMAKQKKLNQPKKKVAAQQVEQQSLFEL